MDVIEDAKLHQLRAWLSGQKAVPPSFVTRDRLVALGLDGAGIARAMRFAADPYNHGADPFLSHDERMAHRERLRAAHGNSQAPIAVAEPKSVEHWAARVDPFGAAEQLRRARAKAGTITPQED